MPHLVCTTVLKWYTPEDQIIQEAEREAKQAAKDFE